MNFATYNGCVMTENSRKIAVITGDLVGSTELGPEKIERAFAALSDCATVQANWHEAPLHFTRHRGDGWQVVLERPELALRSALAFRAALRAEGREFDSYMGIAEGQVTGEIGPDLNEEADSVFTHSGWAINAAKKLNRQKLLLSYGELLYAAAVLADEISQNWTPTQAQTILAVISPEEKTNYTKIAKKLGKSRQAVTKSLEGASFEAVSTALLFIESNSDA